MQCTMNYQHLSQKRKSRQILLMEQLVYKNYGNKAKDFIFTKDFTGKNR